MDLIDGNYKDVATKGIIEIVSGGLGKIVKKNSYIKGISEQILESHLTFYENGVESKVSEEEEN